MSQTSPERARNRAVARVPAGVPAGGQFAPGSSGESGVALAVGAVGERRQPGQSDNPANLSTLRPPSTRQLAHAGLVRHVPSTGSDGERALWAAHEAGRIDPDADPVHVTNRVLADLEASGLDTSLAWQDMSGPDTITAKAADRENLRWVIGRVVYESQQRENPTERSARIGSELAELERTGRVARDRAEAATRDAYRSSARAVALTALRDAPDARYIDFKDSGGRYALVVLRADGSPVEAGNDAEDDLRDAMLGFDSRRPAYWHEYVAHGEDGKAGLAVGKHDGTVHEARLDLARMLGTGSGD